MNEIVCNVLTMDPATFAITFGSGIAFGLSLDRWVIPAAIRGWVALMRRVGRLRLHAG